jgi:ABC-type lipoprotein release transport system permease subunit
LTPAFQEDIVLLQYAWKGFCRRRIRSILTVLGIALSIALLVAVVTITRSVERAVAGALDAAGADMVIQKQVKMCPFRIVKLPKDLAAIDQSVVGKLRNHEGVQEISGVLELWAFYFAEGEAGVNLPFPKKQKADSSKASSAADRAMPSDSQGLPMIIGPDGQPKSLQPTVVAGIDPTKKTIGPVRIASNDDVEEGQTCCAITRGRYLVPGDDYFVMITEQYAEVHGYDLGDMIPLGPTHKFEVVALIDISGAARIAGAEAFIPLNIAQDMLGQGDVVDTIAQRCGGNLRQRTHRRECEHHHGGECRRRHRRARGRNSQLPTCRLQPRVDLRRALVGLQRPR